MKESATYQAILEEGREEGREEGALAEARKLLRVYGDRAFGPPSEALAATLEHLDDLGRIEALFDRLPTVRSWQQLLGQPAAGRRGRRRSAGGGGTST